jgi:unsaturated chondroitin disaccharide hydrolase
MPDNKIVKMCKVELSPASCWSRGQAWAIYGFLQSYRHTHDPAFADCFRRLLGFWADHVPPDHVPYWDFYAPAVTQHVRDTSAAAITCAALLLAQQWGIMTNSEAKQLYHQTILSLKQHYLQPRASDGILANGCLHFPAGRGVNEAMVFGDYFFLEALIGTLEEQ